MSDRAHRLPTPRLDPIAATVEHVRAELEALEELRAFLGAVVPPSRPPGLLVHRLMRYCSFPLAAVLSATTLLFGCRTAPPNAAELGDAASAEPAPTATSPAASASPEGDAGLGGGESSASAVPPGSVPSSLRVEIQKLAAEMVARPVDAAPGGGAPAGPMLLYSHVFAGYALVDAALDEPSLQGEITPLLDGIIERVSSPADSRPFGAERVTVAGRVIAKSIAPRGHLALLLAGRRLIAPLSAEREALLDALVDGLAEDIERTKHHLLPTYGRRIWPADNEVVAAALSIVAARAHTTARVGHALQLLQGSLRELEAEGLPPSAVAPGALAGTDVPRGCALSWTIALRSLYDRESARRLYSRYRRSFWVEMGPLAGFREWPPGVRRPPDVDSGPIVMGIGTAATAFGIGAARGAGESRDEAMLLGTAIAGGLERETARGRSWLDRAIASFARTVRPWT